MTQANAVFTAHVHALVQEREISAEELAPMWAKLRAAVLCELRQRGLSQAPPRYLGFCGAPCWTPDALEDLLLDCYSAAFLRRLRSLKGQLKVRRNIDGLIFRNIRNYLHDHQKKHDPLGFRVFNLLRTATLEAVEARELHILSGGPNLGNSSLLSCHPRAPESEAEFDPDLESVAAQWNDGLLPDLITALGKTQQRVVVQLRQCLRDLGTRHGIETFHFGALCSPLKCDARRRWAAVWQDEEGEIVVADSGAREFLLTYRARAGKAVEDQDRFEKLLSGVGKGLDHLDEDSQTCDYLRRLWTFYRCHAADKAVPEIDDPDVAVQLPSQRKLARLLGIPRDRLPRLHRLLQQGVDDCFRQFRNPAVMSEPKGEVDS